MGKKAKSKARLDKFYTLAKEQGYRSRAAFKLIQLNRKYNLLNNCNVVLDLCAAPGGWLQVASQVMPLHSTIIGIDLVSIKAIPGVITLMQDITAPACFQMVKNQLKGQEVDLCLHDGAPNVGASWAKDAYSQNELVLHSLKLATSFLKQGGTFVTKVFRSADYNSLLWVFKKLFEKVEATKPIASRNVSAEIFVVCLGFIAPKYMDEKLFSADYVFKESEADLTAQARQLEITSVSKLFEKRRRRTGYDADAPMVLYKTLHFDEFMKAQNPFPLFLEYNKLELTEDEKVKYAALAKLPPDFDELCSDIQVLGKREVLQLLKWRSKIKHQLMEQRRKEKKVPATASTAGDEQEEKWDTDDEELQYEEDDNQSRKSHKSNKKDTVESKEDGGDENEEVYEDLVEMQMELLENKAKEDQKQDIKGMRRKNEKQQKLAKKMPMNVHSAIGIDQDEELFTIQKHSNKLKGAKFIDFDIEDENKIVENENTLDFKNAEELNQTLEDMYERKQQRKSDAQTKTSTNARVKKNQHRQDEEHEYDSDQLACEPLKKKVKVPMSQTEKKELKQSLSNKFFDREIFQDLKNQLSKNDKTQSTFVNPLKSMKQNKEANQKKNKESQQVNKTDNIFDSDNEEQPNPNPKNLNKLQKSVQFDLDGIGMNYDQKISQEPFPDEDEKIKRYELKLPISEMERRRKRLKKEQNKVDKKKGEQKDDDPNKGDFEVVAHKTLDDYKIDDLAFNRALAKKMMRTNIRDDIIERSFSRHAQEDDNLPKWFMDDELRHQYKIEPITKEEFAAERQKLLAINSQVPKKVMEFKIRRWKKAQKKMRKASKKAQQVFEQDGINELVKMKQVKKIYKKEANEEKKEKEKKYIVSKKGRPIKGGNTATVKMVDKRLKKDKRAQKAQAKSGKIKKIGGGKKREQVHRHKGRKQKS